MALITERQEPVYLDLALQGFEIQMQQAAQQQLTGCLVFTCSETLRFCLVFRLGRIIWATEGEHRFRRWHRLLRLICPELYPHLRKLQAFQSSLLWEYQVLTHLFQEGRVGRAAIAQIIQENIQEVLFELIQNFSAVERIDTLEGEDYCAGQIAFLPPIGKTVEPVQNLWNCWRAAQLEAYSPNLAPIICDRTTLQNRVSANTYNTLSNFLKGQLSLREIAPLLSQHFLALTQSLAIYERQDLIQFERIKDFPPPWPRATEAKNQNSTQQTPLVFCIDDNPNVCSHLGQMVQGFGYRYASVQDSVRALQEIIEQKPDLVFVDLVMPVISGYELCTQIRRVSFLRDIPLVILTSNDGMVDRLRSKIVGATEFVSKPIQSDKIAMVLDRYIPLTLRSAP